MSKKLNFSSFFDLKDFPYAEIFKEGELWDPIKNLSAFINNLFEKGFIKPNYKNSANIFIGEGTIIKEGTLITGPAIIGKNCILGHSCFIRENCLFGNNVNIGHAVEVKNSIFLNGSASAHLNYIGDSIIGSTVNISGGTITANFRLDRKPIKIKVDGELIDTGLNKLGAIIGDNSNIGVNSVLNPGTILGKSTVVYPLLNVRGIHKESEIIRE
jgi:UDP-N-acetylglucosamine diphosphorylase / glucose-1-phosphate thymidylyltransferase / UDP-N-acetylgalactosamine diphosphorylase / glucosamine-1-phosphate N-acetyltransferase / galactosamine-1-phosphate N-acetyltransferase